MRFLLFYARFVRKTWCFIAQNRGEYPHFELVAVTYANLICAAQILLLAWFIWLNMCALACSFTGLPACLIFENVTDVTDVTALGFSII